MITRRATTLLLASALALAACGGEQDETAAVPAGAEGEPAGAMEGMPGMGGMEGMQGGMMNRMAAHMQRMHAAGAESMVAMLPMHRQMVANMIAQMNSEMREMNMAMDARWTATVDSLRADLTRMPDMSGPELQALMPEHHDRVMRLMEMHREMMAQPAARP